VSLATPDSVRRLQRKLYVKAKQEPEYRFYLLYDKVCRDDILAHAYRLSRAARGAAGVDGVAFADIEAAGVEPGLAALRKELCERTYRPAPVRRVLIPKPGGGERPRGIPTVPPYCASVQHGVGIASGHASLPSARRPPAPDPV
jgi:RNA-directed DNA polymerase